MEASVLLSKEFFEFSSKIKDLYLEKNKINDEFKAIYADYKSRLRAIDEESLVLQSEMCFKNKKDKKQKTTIPQTQVVEQG